MWDGLSLDQQQQVCAQSAGQHGDKTLRLIEKKNQLFVGHTSVTHCLRAEGVGWKFRDMFPFRGGMSGWTPPLGVLGWDWGWTLLPLVIGKSGKQTN